MWGTTRRWIWTTAARGLVATCALILLTAVGLEAGYQPARDGARADTLEALEELAARATAAVVLIDVDAGDESRQGSGFLVDPDGLIVTNYHVVRNARTARVRLASGDVFERVSVLGIDEKRDIAALRIPGFGLPFLPLGNSDSVRIGTPAIAIGSPLGLENTVSTGIVSGRRQEPAGFQLLQITAPASPGSSGGPVLTREGLVMGIAASQFRRGQNLNFAVPINYARGLLAQLDGTPLVVIPPAGETAPNPRSLEISRGDERGSVNSGLAFSLQGFRGYRVDLEAKRGSAGLKRTRITFRRIEDIAGGDPRIERFEEGETTEARGTFETPQIVRRERSRTIVNAANLRPISARGQIDWAVDGEWRRTEYDLEFDGYKVRGTIRDSSGVTQQIDRELPPGILLRDVRHLAFATLAAEELEGRSVEFVTFDPRSGQITTDRYDVRGPQELTVAGESHRALEVDLASGLSNSTGLFRIPAPRILLRQVGGDAWDVEEVVSLEIF